MYNITFAQLIVIWVFGAFLTLISFFHGLAQSDIFFALIIPAFVWAVLIFYTLGWKTRRTNPPIIAAVPEPENKNEGAKGEDEMS